MAKAVLVIGGTGAFGRLLVAGLVRTTGLDVILGARGAARARDFAGTLDPKRIRVLQLDTASVTAETLRGSGAFAIVDAAGPFQGADYRLARAAISAGMHYLDLADARDFVTGFAVLDPAAREAGIVALSGASSTPALSHAVLDRLTAGWRRVDTVEIAIAPGNRSAPRGLSVTRAILSYSGRPVRVFEGGAWTTRPGWGMTRRRDLPGLGRRLLSLVETPDLDLVPLRLRPRVSAIFRAGLELPVLHLGLVAASLAVRWRILPSLAPFARPFRWIARSLARFGTDRGGMVVTATGIDAEGAAIRAEWSLVAEADDGPVIATLPALALIRRLADGPPIPAGAGPCVGVLSLDEIAGEFAPYRIATEIKIGLAMPPSPFQILLGDGFAQLPAPVRRLHSLAADIDTAGRADITAAPGLGARLIRGLSGLPAAGRGIEVAVAFHADGKGGEFWRRRFGRRRYRSGFEIGTGRRAGLLCERFFPFVFFHRLTPSPEGLRWDLVAWRLLFLPLPRWTMPRAVRFESGDGDRFVFDINAGFPLVGTVVHYRGWLLPRD